MNEQNSNVNNEKQQRKRQKQQYPYTFRLSGNVYSGASVQIVSATETLDRRVMIVFEFVCASRVTCNIC